MGDLGMTKFLTFSERLRRIDVKDARRHTDPRDVYMEIVPSASTTTSSSSSHPHHDLESSSSFFRIALQRWREKNSTREFKAFSRDLGQRAESFHLLLLHASDIARLLEDHLRTGGSYGMALVPLVDLQAQFARDIGGEFFPFLPSCIKVYSDILLATSGANKEAATVIESIFTSLSYMFKFLRKQIVENANSESLFDALTAFISPNQKDYVHRFFAEAYSFILRKLPPEKIDRHVDLLLGFARSSNDSRCHKAVGLVLFNSVKLVEQQFHSKAGDFLALFLNKVRETERSDPAFSTVCFCFENCAEYSRKEYCDVLWDSLFAEADIISADKASQKEQERCPRVARISELLLLVSTWRNGTRITSSAIEKIDALIMKFLDFHILLDDDSLQCVMQLAALLLPRLTIRRSLFLTEAILSVKNPSIILEFCNKAAKSSTIHSDAYEAIFRFCGHCLTQESSDNVVNAALRGLAQFNDSRPDGISHLYDVSLSNTIYKMLGKYSKSATKSDHTALYLLLRCVRNTPRENHPCKLIFEIAVALKKEMEDKGCNRSDILLLVGEALSVSLAFDEDSDVSSNTEIDEFIIEMLCVYSNNVSILQIGLELARQQSRSLGLGQINLDLFKKILKALLPSIGSPQGTIRLLALQIMEILCKRTYENASDVFECCRLAESVPADVINYRKRSLYVRKLMSSSYIETSPPELKDVPLVYMLGSLYINFNKAWDDAREILVFYSRLDAKWFWSHFSIRLRGASVGSKTQYLSVPDVSKISDDSPKSINDPFHLALKSLNTEDRVDHANVLSLMCTILIDLISVLEKYHREIVLLFLDFWEDEYISTFGAHASMMDLTKSGPFVPSYDSAIQEEMAESCYVKEASQRRKMVNNKLLVYLNVFRNFRNARAMHQSTRMERIFRELLLRSHSEVQKRAFDCLVAFKFKYIVPYKEAIGKMITESTNQNAMVAFSIEGETCTLLPEHRNEILRILSPILVGQMLTRKGQNRGKHSPGMKRGVIIRYLMGYSPLELEDFINVVMRPLEHVLPLHDLRLCSVEHLNFLDSKKFDVNEAVPPKAQLGLLNVIGDLLRLQRTRLEPYLHHFVVSVLRICYDSNMALLAHNITIPQLHLSVVKSVRSLSIKILADLFNIMHDDEKIFIYTECVMEHVVKPQLYNLKNESLQSPTPLLKLFMLWSDHKTLVPLLGECNGTIIPEILPLLSRVGVKSCVIDAVFSLVKNILKPEVSTTSHSRESLGKENILYPHIHILLHHMCLRLQIVSPTGDKDKSKIASEMELEILRLLSEFETDFDQSKTIVKLLFPSVLDKLTTTSKQNILKTTETWLYVHKRQDLVDFALICQAFSVVHERIEREALVSVFRAYSTCDSSISKISDIVVDLNSYSTEAIGDEPDFLRRMKAFRSLGSKALCSSFTSKQLLPVLHVCIFFALHSDDTSLRASSYSVIAAIATSQDGSKDNINENEKKYDLSGIVLKNVKSGLRSRKGRVREDFMELLGNMIRQANKESPLSDMKCLLSEGNEEQNFFSNAVHIQLHRRTRAMQSLGKYVEEQRLSVFNMISYFLPYATAIIRDPPKQREHQLVGEAIGCIGKICHRLSWKLYYATLRRFFKWAKLEPGQQKIYLRVIVQILDKFHFSTESVHAKDSDHNLDDAIDDPDEDCELKDFNTQSQSTDPQKVFGVVVNTILPTLNSFLLLKDGEMSGVLNGPVPLAIVKLLIKLPKSEMERHLAPLLTKICQILRVRLESARITARSVLMKICVMIGSFYLPFVVKELKAALTRGYQLHVLGYTVHAIINNMATADSGSGFCDQCIDDLAEVFMEDIFGDVAKEKEVEALANKLKEGKVTRGYDGFNLIARYCSPDHFPCILDPIKEIMDISNSKRTNRKIQRILTGISQGITKNNAVGTDDLMDLVFSILTENGSGKCKKSPEPIKKSIDSKGRSYVVSRRLYSTFLLEKAVSREGRAASNYKDMNRHLLVEFSLEILMAILRKPADGLQKGDTVDGLRSRLDPVFPLVVLELKAKQDHVVAQSLKVLVDICRHGDYLDSFKSGVNTMMNRVFRLMTRSATSSESEIPRSCFKLVSTILRSSSQYKILPRQAVVLLSFIEADLDISERQGAAFTLLKSIVILRIVIPEVYDIMERVGQLMVKSQSKSVRTQCRDVYLKFLLEYPQSKMRIQNTMTFLVTNLDYDYETGRESILELLNSVVIRFPVDIVNNYAELLLLPLVIRLVNEDSANLHKMTTEVLKTLFMRVDATQQEKLFRMLMAWANSGVTVCKAALQSLGIFLDAGAVGKSKRAPEIFRCLSKLIIDSREAITSVNNEDWRLPYSALSTTAKLLGVFPKLLNDLESTEEISMKKVDNKSSVTNMLEFWDALKDHLEYSHNWVRLASSRIFGIYFASLDAVRLALRIGKGEFNYFHRRGNIFEIGRCFLKQLQSDHLEKEQIDQLAKNILFDSLESTIDSPGSTKSASPISVSHDTSETFDSAPNPNPSGIVYILKQLNFISRQGKGQLLLKRESCVVKLFSAFISIFADNYNLNALLETLVEPIFRRMEGVGSPDQEAESLAKESIELIKRTVGVECFVEAYEKVRIRVASARKERRNKRAREAILDPEAYSKRRINSNLRKKENRKRRIDKKREGEGRSVRQKQ
eukprot:UC4_evm2s1377